MILTQYAEENAKKPIKSSDEEISKMLDKFAGERKKWRESRFVIAMKDKMGNNEISTISKKMLGDMIVSQNRKLSDAFLLKMEEQRRMSKLSDEETICEWMTQIQLAQEQEVNATVEAIENQTDDIIDLIREQHFRSRRECWNDLIFHVIFGLTLPGQQQVEDNEIVENDEEEIKEQISSEVEVMNENIEKARADLQDKKAKGIDVEAALEALNKQFEANKQALESGSSEQRRRIGRRIEARRKEKMSSEFEVHQAAGMMMLAQRRMHQREQFDKVQHNKQQHMIDQLLQSRKEKRKENKETTKKKTAATKGKAPKSQHSPFEPMRREKTIIDIKVSESERNKVVESIRNLADQKMKALEQERMKQKEKIKQRKEQARSRRGEETIIDIKVSESGRNKVVESIRNL